MVFDELAWSTRQQAVPMHMSSFASPPGAEAPGGEAKDLTSDQPSSAEILRCAGFH